MHALLRLLLLICSVAFAALVSAEDGPGQQNYFTTKDGIKIRYMTLGSQGSTSSCITATPAVPSSCSC